MLLLDITNKTEVISTIPCLCAFQSCFHFANRNKRISLWVKYFFLSSSKWTNPALSVTAYQKVSCVKTVSDTTTDHDCSVLNTCMPVTQLPVYTHTVRYTTVSSLVHNTAILCNVIFEQNLFTIHQCMSFPTQALVLLKHKPKNCL